MAPIQDVEVGDCSDLETMRCKQASGSTTIPNVNHACLFSDASEEALGKPTTGVKDMIQDQLDRWDEEVRSNDRVIQDKKGNNVVAHQMKRYSLIRGCVSRAPRLYYFILHLVLPLFALLLIAFICGSIMATMESPGEIRDNNAAVAGTFSAYSEYLERQKNIRTSISSIPELCINNSNASSFLYDSLSPSERSDFTNNVTQCANSKADVNFSIVEFYPDFFESATPELSFDWTSCGRMELSNGSQSDKMKQFKQFVTDFAIDFFKIMNTSIDGLYHFNNTEIILALSQASGAQSCGPHYVGGAWIWFTLMTTIGYGNAVPSTIGGQVLCYTIGFLTIIGFVGLNSTASAYMLTVVDDMLLRLKLESLTKGMASVLIWFCMCVVWMLVLALVVSHWLIIRSDYDLALSDAFWFSYITITTVGFGDKSLPQEEIRIGDMFIIPLVILIGFVFLGNFASKLVEVVGVWFPADDTLECILASRRESQFPKSPMTAIQASFVKSSSVIQRRHSL